LYGRRRGLPARTPTPSGGYARYAASAWTPILIYNPRHLLAILEEYVRHYNQHRPHQGREQRPPALETSPAPVTDLTAVRIRRRRVLNGMINEYSQAA
jgi:hypothetical protein